MLSNELNKRLEGIEDASKKGYPIRNLYRMMCDPSIWVQAYSNIHQNDGAITPGVSKDDTLDGFSLQRAEQLAQLLRERKYVSKPVRRVEIPKSNGKTRPLGIPAGNDKLAQEAARILLERVYEPIFKDSSHGFRLNKSCQTALNEIRPKWNGVKWIIDVDIKGFFDNIPHDKLLKALAKKIDDKNFLNLIEQWLKAGYMEGWNYHRTYSGTPQGGIVSPILANIYLHELDTFVEGLISTFTNGSNRKRNPEMQRLAYKIHKLRKQVDQIIDNPNRKEEVLNKKREIETLLEEKRQIPSQLMDDPNFKRMYYIRYADDFIIGLIGSKQDAEHIARQVKHFIADSLELEANEDKTKIKHIGEGISFLGYEIRSCDPQKRLKEIVYGRHTVRRTTIGVTQLYVPTEVPHKFCHEKGYGNYQQLVATHRNYLLHLSDAEIILTYNAELRGLINYYLLACDTKWKFKRLYFIWQTSLFKILANKRQSNVVNIIKQLKQPNGEFIHKVQVENGYKEFVVLKLKHLKN